MHQAMNTGNHSKPLPGGPDGNGRDHGGGGHYDRMTILFHWLTAIIVITQFITANLWPFLQRGTSPRLGLIGTHLTLGICLAVLIILRLGWRLFFGARRPVPLPYRHRILADLTHVALYGLLIAQVVLGFLLGWGSGRTIAFAGIPAIPPLVTLTQESRHLVGGLHEDVAWIIIVLAAAHACAGLFHHYVLRDGVLRSMLAARPRR